jgi:hypothetical protein
VPVDLKGSASLLLKDILIKDESHLSEKNRWNVKHFNTLQAFYGKAPYFKKYKEFFTALYLQQKWERLSDLNFAILKHAFELFGIECRVEMGSKLGFKEKKSDLVLEHAVRFEADLVVTGTLGKNYIDEKKFNENGIHVYHQNYVHPIYGQRFEGFLPYMSYVDLLFNLGSDRSREVIRDGNVTKEELCRNFGLTTKS